jgi:glycerate 2-kinase
MTTMRDRAREQLIRCYRAALDAVGGRAAVRRALQARPMEEPFALLAVGKAAAAMTEGVLDAQAAGFRQGLLITKHGHLSDRCRQPGLRCLESAHPIADASSLAAGQAMLQFLDELPEGLPLLALISGGASSLVEVLPQGGDAAVLERLNRWLLSHPLAIGEINRIRRAVSCIKGGRLAERLGGRTCRVLLISDVPGDDPAVIGSGLLAPSSEPAAPADELPDWLRPLAAAAPPLPSPAAPCFRSVAVERVADNRQAREAAAEQARTLGLSVIVHEELVQGETDEAASWLVREMQKGQLQIWGGETTVELPKNPGRGGRAQALALAVAMRLDGGPPAWFLAAGTDGTDGPGEDAGALVDEQSCERGRSAGLDPAECLRRANSGRFLAASGDLLTTGPTGTNVMDLMFALSVDTP